MTELTPYVNQIRKRIEIEDSLLNNRTTIFLATNGLWVAVVGIGSDAAIRLGIVVLGVLVSTMWVMCSWQSWRAISELTKEYLATASTNKIEVIMEMEAIMKRSLWKPGWKRPTDILARWLPILFLIAWAVALPWLIVRLWRGV